MIIEIALDTDTARIARQHAHNMTADQLDHDRDLRRVEIGEVECFSWAAEGYQEQNGEGIKLTCWVDIRDSGVQVVAVRTDDREDVLVDYDIEQAVLISLRSDADEAA